MATKKIRLVAEDLDEDDVESTQAPEPTNKFYQDIDWKLWEMYKLAEAAAEREERIAKSLERIEKIMTKIAVANDMIEVETVERPSVNKKSKP